MRLMRYIPWLAALLVLGLLLWVYRINRAGPPVQYPPGWPLAYVKVPHGASADALPLTVQFNRTAMAEVRPWGPDNDTRTDNLQRSWHVGFRYSGSYEEAKADLERQLAGKGWGRHGGVGVTTYWSADLLHSIKLSHLPGHWSLTQRWPESWELAVYEYRDPVDYYPAAQMATPLDEGK